MIRPRTVHHYTEPPAHEPPLHRTPQAGLSLLTEVFFPILLLLLPILPFPGTVTVYVPCSSIKIEIIIIIPLNDI